jgi:hypothetical protein
MGVALILAPHTAKPYTSLHVQPMLTLHFDRVSDTCDLRLRCNDSPWVRTQLLDRGLEGTLVHGVFNTANYSMHV